MKLRAAGLAAALALSLSTLAACGSDDDSSPSSSASSEKSSEPTDEATDDSAEGAASTDDYSFTPPEGWQDVSDTVPQADLAFADTTPDGFAENINVITLDSPGDVNDGALAQATQQLEALGATDIQSFDSPDVDGEKSVAVSAIAGDGTYQTLQVFTFHDGKSFTLTITTPTGTSMDDQTDLFDSILNSWTWAK